MEVSRSVPRRQECAHVLRHRQRTILRTSANLYDPQISYDPALLGSEGSGDGKRVAERYIYKPKKTVKKEKVSNCPADCIPEYWLRVIKNFFNATDKRLLVIGRTGLYRTHIRHPKPGKVPREHICFYVLTQNIHTSRYICGILTVKNDRAIREGNKLDITFRTTMHKSREHNMHIRYAMHQFFGKYYSLFKLTYPEYTDTITAPPFLMEPLIEIHNE